LVLYRRFLFLTMSSSFKKKSGSQVEFLLLVSEESFGKAEKSVLDDWKKNAKLPGFRKGTVPEHLLKSSIPPQQFYLDSLEKAVDRSYRSFIDEHKLHPVSTPQLNMKKKEGFPLEIEITVEVFPEIQLGNYKKIAFKKETMIVSDEEIKSVLQEMMLELGIGQKVDRSAQKGDIVKVSFVGKENEKEIPSTKGTEVSLCLGQGRFLSDLESAFVGMRAGEKKEKVKVSFPKDYGSSDFAGKKILFDVELFDVLDANPSFLTSEDIIRMIGREMTLDDLKKEIHTVLLSRKKQDHFKHLQDQYKVELGKLVKIDLPLSWIEEEVQHRFHHLLQSPLYKKDPENFWKQMGKTEYELKKEWKKVAEENLKILLSLSEIVKVENIQISPEEESEIFHHFQHQHVGKKVDPSHQLKEIENLRLSYKIDKYFRGLTL